jgi:hypothetical protein
MRADKDTPFRVVLILEICSIKPSTILRISVRVVKSSSSVDMRHRLQIKLLVAHCHKQNYVLSVSSILDRINSVCHVLSLIQNNKNSIVFLSILLLYYRMKSILHHNLLSNLKTLQSVSSAHILVHRDCNWKESRFHIGRT